METITNRFGNQGGLFSRFNLSLLVFCLALLTGCKPAGPRAVLQGKRLIERGKYAQAVERLTTATTLLVTNAQAWNYLGLAWHYAGKGAEAEKAYRRALALDQDLSEAHYNLGCLLLEGNRHEAAKTEFTAYTLRRGTSLDGLLRLGTAQLRSGISARRSNVQLAGRELSAAEKSFQDALRLGPQNPEAINGLGLVRLERGRASEAAQYFNSALKQQPGYGPALLNLAIVSHQYLKDRSVALQKYREYLALKPPPDNQEAVRSVAHQLELELEPPARPAAATIPAPVNTNASAPKAASTDLNVARPSVAPKPEPVVAVPKAVAAASPPKPEPLLPPAPSPNVEVVKVAPEPVFKPAQDVVATPRPTKAPTSEPLTSAFLAPPRVAESPVPSQPAPGRYAYKSPAKPASGNRAEAERLFAQGAQAQQAHRVAEAIQGYRAATRLDPSYFDANYNLGLAATEAGDLPAALSAYEHALAIRPDSLDARYNFALVLKQANFLADAANELEKLLANYPNESRAHLALGNLCAQQLHEPAKARQHYLKALETDPKNPQAGAIRFWLTQNPQ